MFQGCALALPSVSTTSSTSDDLHAPYACPPALVTPADETVDPWFLLGNAYSEQSRLSEAEHAYRQALVRAPNARAQHNLGLVQLQLGLHNLREAAAALPADKQTRRDTRNFVRTLLEAAP